MRGGGKGGPEPPLRGLFPPEVEGLWPVVAGGLSRLISLLSIGGLLPLLVGDPDIFLLPKAKVSLSPPLRKTKQMPKNAKNVVTHNYP